MYTGAVLYVADKIVGRQNRVVDPTTPDFDGFRPAVMNDKKKIKNIYAFIASRFKLKTLASIFS
jgi:hypothetical protein